MFIWGTGIVIIQGVILMLVVWLLKKKQVWPLIMLALRGGSLALKGYPNNEVELLHSRNPITQVPWKVKNPTTKKTETVFQPLKRVYHTLKGTSYPIHLCPYGPTNISMTNVKRSSELNVEEINALMTKQYTQGYSDATSFKTVAGFPIDKATLLMLFIVGVMCVILLAVNVQILGAVSPV